MVSVVPAEPGEGLTRLKIRNGDEDERDMAYRMFVDCSGQKAIDLVAFPFPTLVSDGTVRKARARFADPAEVAGLGDDERKHLVNDAEEPALHTGGIDVDAAYQVVGSNGAACPRVYNIAFPAHVRCPPVLPDGLQACRDERDHGAGLDLGKCRRG